MFQRIIHIGDLPVYFRAVAPGNKKLLQVDALDSREQVMDLLNMGNQYRGEAEGIFVMGDPEKNFRMLKKNVLSIQAAGGAVFNDRGELLIIHRLGKWDLPKGKMEKGETKKECAMREVEEETNVRGLNITERLPNTYHTYQINDQWVLKKSIWYRMSASEWKNTRPQTEEDIDEILWVKPEDLDVQNIDTYATIRYLLLAL